eukprot:96123-Chlamydomonas_euryale.AAC.1
MECPKKLMKYAPVTWLQVRGARVCNSSFITCKATRRSRPAGWTECMSGFVRLAGRRPTVYRPATVRVWGHAAHVRVWGHAAHVRVWGHTAHVRVWGHTAH